MILWLVAIGVISILGQVVLLRELNVAFYGSELVYVLALGVWLLWTAVGAAAGRRAHVPSERRVRLLLLAAAWVLPLAVVLSRGLRILFGGVPGAYLPFPRQLAGMALALLPVSLMMGLLFQWAAKRYVGERRTLAAAYAIESVGALIGGMLATLPPQVGRAESRGRAHLLRHRDRRGVSSLETGSTALAGASRDRHRPRALTRLRAKRRTRPLHNGLEPPAAARHARLAVRTDHGHRDRGTVLCLRKRCAGL